MDRSAAGTGRRHHPEADMTAARVFWIDEQFDREHGDRYATEVLRRTDAFADAWGDIAPVTFAAAAWQLATGLSPGYVRWHRRIIAASCRRNPWDGGLTCAVTVASRWPAGLTATRGWQHDRGWRDWPQMFGQYTTPTDHDLARSPHVRATLQVDAPLPLDGLPPAPDGPGPEAAAAARRAVIVVTRHLDELLGPMINQLDAEESRSP
jgi:hypothetical protein